MKRLETSVEIKRSTSDIFSFLSDPSNMPKWAPGYLLGEWITGMPIRIGSKQKRVTNFGGRDQESVYTVTQFEENKVIAFTSKSGPLVIEEIIEIENISGGTKVVIAEEVSAQFLLKPAEWIFAAMAKRNIHMYGEGLKNILE